MRYLLHYTDRDLYDLTKARVDLFYFEEIALREHLPIPQGKRLRYWSGATAWPNCNNLGYLFYLWISAVLEPVRPAVSYHFVCMNHNPRPHRRSLLDRLWAADLFDSAVISWPLAETTPWSEHCRGWLGSSRHPENSLPVLRLPQAELGSAAFSLVTETHSDVFDISEKTFQCISAGQPFLVSGAAGVHAWLHRLGFEPLPGVDYAFDSEQDLLCRQSLLVEQLQRLCQQDPVHLRQCFQPVADHNQRLFARIHANLRLPFKADTYDVVGPAAQQQIEDLQEIQRRYRIRNSRA